MKYEPGKVYENLSEGRTAVVIKSFKYYYIDVTYKKFSWLPAWNWNVVNCPGAVEYISLSELEEDVDNWLQEGKFSDHALPRVAVIDRLYEYRGRRATIYRNDQSTPYSYRWYYYSDDGESSLKGKGNVWHYYDLRKVTNDMNKYLISGMVTGHP